jgi:hypothetical protein
MPGGIQIPLVQWLIWPAPNYKNPDTKPSYVLITSCILGPISIAILFARLWVRVRLQRNAGLDDWLMLAALVSMSKHPAYSDSQFQVPMIAMTVIIPLGEYWIYPVHCNYANYSQAWKDTASTAMSGTWRNKTIQSSARSSWPSTRSSPLHPVWSRCPYSSSIDVSHHVPYLPSSNGSCES